MVSTFAGRGSASASSYKWGKQNGEVRERARFNKPVALAYDEATKTFYVGDSGNFKIRKIAKEQASDDLVSYHKHYFLRPMFSAFGVSPFQQYCWPPGYARD